MCLWPSWQCWKLLDEFILGAWGREGALVTPLLSLYCLAVGALWWCACCFYTGPGVVFAIAFNTSVLQVAELSLVAEVLAPKALYELAGILEVLYSNVEVLDFSHFFQKI